METTSDLPKTVTISPHNRDTLLDGGGKPFAVIFGASEYAATERATKLYRLLRDRDAVECLGILLQTVADDGLLERLTTPEFRARCEAITGPIKSMRF